jgi:hypothetical protein
LEHKSVQFIDSDYRELFRIPDGESIRITYPPDDGREPKTRACKYIDPYHLRVGNEDYHICEFAEAMERLGAKYEPAEQLRDVELFPYAAGEDKHYTFNREEGNTCIGHIAGDFGRQGDRFHSNWGDRESGRDRDTAEFRVDMHRAIYALRQGLLKDRDSMTAYCRAHPEGRLPIESNIEFYGYQLDTESRQYFVSCTLGEDSRFIIYPYDKAAPVLEQSQPAMTVEKQVAAAQIMPGTDNPEMFYRNNEENGLCVGYLRGDFGRGGNEFHHSWFEQDNGRKTPEFQAEFQLVMDKLRRDVLKDLQASRSFCYAHKEAQLPDRDGHYYGFKLETESRNYFIRCTTLANDYFYIYAYDKAAPVIGREQPAEKPSVLEQIRDSQKAPKPPRKAKTASKGKDGAEL